MLRGKPFQTVPKESSYSREKRIIQSLASDGSTPSWEARKNMEEAASMAEVRRDQELWEGNGPRFAPFGRRFSQQFASTENSYHTPSRPRGTSPTPEFNQEELLDSWEATGNTATEQQKAKKEFVSRQSLIRRCSKKVV